MERFWKPIFLGLLALVGPLSLTLSPAAARAASADGAFLALRDADARVALIGYRLAAGNPALCTENLAPLTGLSLHALPQYDVRDHGAVQRLFGLAAAPGVMAVVPGSPADRAGLRANDQILAVNGVALGQAGAAGRRTRATVDHANATLATALARGRVTLTVERQGEAMAITLEPRSGCGSEIELMSNDAVNAWADGRHVLIGGGLFDRCADDDSLALVIAHEMAHNVLDRRSKPPRGRAAEIAADALAMKLLMAAGYDPMRAIAGLERLIRQGGASISHPAPQRRIAALQAVAITPLP